MHSKDGRAKKGNLENMSSNFTQEDSNQVKYYVEFPNDEEFGKGVTSEIVEKYIVLN